jgi:GDP-L-fucose synthase
MMLVQSQAYRQQYGFNSIFLLPVNLYGPGDNFSFRSSHVIPALIRKFHLANLLSVGDIDSIVDDFLRNHDNEFFVGGSRVIVDGATSKADIVKVLECIGVSLERESASQTTSSSAVVELWGTGNATREFVHVEDAAEAIILATELYNKGEPVNIGAGFEISIRDLSGLISDLSDFQGRILWDDTKPDGQPRRMLSTQKAKREFSFEAKASLREGLRETIAWYDSYVS